VQTFLPVPDFAATAALLDRKRLGGQRVEAYQILRGLIVPGHGYRHHPAVKMWTGHEEALARYALTICEVWSGLGCADTVADKVRATVASIGIDHVRTEAELVAAGALPTWFGNPDFHRSHQSALVRKLPDHYGPLFPGVPDDLPYVWPSKAT
jgi:hypothetical protein